MILPFDRENPIFANINRLQLHNGSRKVRINIFLKKLLHPIKKNQVGGHPRHVLNTIISNHVLFEASLSTDSAF